MKKKALSLCIALALGNNAIAETTVQPTEEEKVCPANISKLTKEQRATLPIKCQTEDNTAMWLWISGGAAALTATLMAFSGDNDDSHNDTLVPDPTPKTGTTEFNNSAAMNWDTQTLTLGTVVYAVSRVDGHYVLTAPDGTTLYTQDGSWRVDQDNNLEITGVNQDNNRWFYDKAEKFYQASDATKVITGNNTSTAIDKDTINTNTSSAATMIVGNDTSTVINGNTTVTGGSGLYIMGDGATLDNNGNVVVSGENAKGIDITGDNARVTLDGDSTITGGGTGTNIDGDNATVYVNGTTEVAGAGSTGMVISGDSNTINQTGNMTVGDLATGLIVQGNSNAVKLSSPEMSVIGNLATGVNVAGQSNTVELTGNMVVDKDQSSPLAADNFFTTSTGIKVNGTDNTVTLGGHLQVIADSELSTTRSYLVKDGSQESIAGVVVTGDNNRVNLMGGVQLTGEVDKLTDTAAGDAVADLRTGQGSTPLIYVDGKSSVYLHGDSTIDGDFPVGYTGVISINNGGYLEIAKDATFSTAGIKSVDVYAAYFGYVMEANNGSSLVNKGTVAIEDASVINVNGGSQAINQGDITLSRTSRSYDEYEIVGMHATTGSVVSNAGKITGKVTNQDSVANLAVTMMSYEVPNDYVSTISLMEAYDGGSAINQASGVLESDGRVFSMVAIDNSTAENYGTINNDGLWKDAGDTTAVPDNVQGQNGVIDYGAGMQAGVLGEFYPWSLKYNATVINHQGGTITVANAGAGMIAVGSTNQAINQGTINLVENASGDATKPLVAMAAYRGGTAINDTTGVININTDIGKAFYVDSDPNSHIVNKGLIVVGEGVDPAVDNSADIVRTSYADGSVLAAEGTTTTLDSLGGETIFGEVVTVTNAGTVKGGIFLVNTLGTLINELTGDLQNALTVNGTLTNQGTISGATTVKDGALNNESTGVINTRITVSGSGKVANSGRMNNGATLNGSAKVTNNGTFTLGSSSSATNASMLELKDTSVFDNLSGGTLTLDNNKNAIHLNNDSTLKNEKGATMTMTKSSHAAGINLWGGLADFINDGTVNATGVTLAASSSDAAAGKAFVWNQDDGVMNFTATTSGQSAVSLTKSNYVGINDGTMNVSGSNGIAMKGSQNAQLVNNGTINLGTEGTTETGMIAMQLDAGATADAVIENNGAINIYAKDSYAFSRLGANGRIINNGIVTLEGEGSGLVKESGVTLEGNGNGGNGTETHAATYTLPVDPTSPAQNNGLRSSVSQYTVGTSADGSAGQMVVSHADLNDVQVDTGFTAGTSAKTASFDNVFEGTDIQGAENITSDSVVWSAQGTTDASGNVDVTMTKNAYTDVTDASVSSVASALEQGYTNNELYSSLNMATSSDVTKAMKQISGSQALNVARDARVLSNRFDMLADAAPEINNGLSFNVVAKGDPRAELSNDTQYDMMALRQKLGFGNNQSLTMEYGIARLDGDGNVSAGQDGITGGYSQFFGLDHAMPIGESGLSWNNGLRYDVHQLDSKRGINYGDVNKQASADTKQQYLELRSEGRKTFNLSEGLDIASYAGVKLRHTLDDGYKETGAGDFNLNMNSTTETAVDSVVGMKLSYAGKNGWAATATVEGGPNLSYSTSGKTASLQGASGQNFAVDDDQKGGGINSMAQVGVKYHAGNTAASLEAFHWKEDGISDKGLMVNYKFNF